MAESPEHDQPPTAKTERRSSPLPGALYAALAETLATAAAEVAMAEQVAETARQLRGEARQLRALHPERGARSKAR